MPSRTCGSLEAALTNRCPATSAYERKRDASSVVCWFLVGSSGPAEYRTQAIAIKLLNFSTRGVFHPSQAYLLSTFLYRTGAVLGVQSQDENSLRFPWMLKVSYDTAVRQGTRSLQLRTNALLSTAKGCDYVVNFYIVLLSQLACAQLCQPRNQRASGKDCWNHIDLAGQHCHCSSVIHAAIYIQRIWA